MKARMFPNAALRKAARETVEQEYDKIYRDISERTKHTMTLQYTALTLYILCTCYGWKKKRLERFISNFMLTVELLNRGVANSKPIDSALVLVDWCKDKFGIDLNQYFVMEYDKDGLPVDTDARRKAAQHKQRVEKQRNKR